MPFVAQLGSVTSHRGTITTGSLTTMVEGKPIARVGDVHVCPLHGTNAIATGSAIFRVDGLPVARIGDTCGCTATIVTGALTVQSA